MKINRIHISNYRAFLVNEDQEATRYIIDLPNGENLLIYGENGSGKSSLFRALKDFFVSALNNGQPFQKNLFYDSGRNSEQPFIEVGIDDSSRHRFSADGNQYILIESIPGSNTNYITQANITNGFISYRDLLKLHFRPKNQDPDLVSLFLGEDGLFSDMNVPAPSNVENKVSFRDLWKKCQRSDTNAVADYNANVLSLFVELEKKANMLLAFFQKKCSLQIDYTDAKLDSEGGNLHAIHLPAISFKVTLFDKEMPEHNDLLNEAKLTALAISVFLAHQLCRPATDLRILFLDDIFIGLDMSNRIPLIKILIADNLGDGTSFKDFQIFLTTYDREWFNVAKSYLNKEWCKVEFYVDNHSSPIERPLIRKSDTYKERSEFHFIQGDYPACANYLRKAYEQIFRNILPKNILYSGLISPDVDASLVEVSKQQLSIKETEHSWLFLPKVPTGAVVSSNRPANLHALIDMFKTLINDYQIPFPHIEELMRIKNRLLNPLSHDDLKSPVFKIDLETGFRILEELIKVKSKVIIDISLINPAFLFFDQKDRTGKEYCYKFQLLANLRYIEYGGKGTLINAECKPVSRRLKSGNIEEVALFQNQRSVYDLCKGILIHSLGRQHKKDIGLDPLSLINLVYTESGQTLAQHI